MSPPATIAIGSRAASRPASSPTSGPPYRSGSSARRTGTATTSTGSGRSSPGATTTMTSELTAATDATARSSIGRPSTVAASLSAPNRRDAPPARTIPLTRGAVTGRSRRRPAGPARVRRASAEDASPAEVLEDRHHVLAARAGRIAQGGRRQRRGSAEGERSALQLAIRGRGVGEVVVEDDDPPGGLELPDPGRAGSRLVGRPRRERRRRRVVERPLEAGHRGEQLRRGAGGGARRVPEAIAVGRDGDRLATSRSIARADEVRGRGSGRASRGGGAPARPPSARRPARSARPASMVASEAGRPAMPPRRAPGATTASRLRRGGPAWPRPKPRRRACATASAARARSGVARRRETPRGGSASRTRPPASVAAGEGRRTTNASPGAAAIGSARRRIAATSPFGRSTASRPLRPTVASTRAVPSMHVDSRAIRSAGTPARGRWRERGRRAERDEQAVGLRRPSGRTVSTVAAGDSRCVDAGEVDRRPTAVGDEHVAAVDLEAADAHRAIRLGEAGAWCRRRSSRRGGCRSRPCRGREPRTRGRPPVARRGHPAARPSDAGPGRGRSSNAARTSVEPLAVRARRDRPPPRREATTDRAASGRARPPRAARSGCDRIGLRHDGEPIGDPEGVEQAEVLERLCPRTVVGRDDEHRGVDLPRADQHVADQPVVARDVDEVELGAVVEARGGRTRRRSSSRAAAPRAAGRRRSRSAPGAAWSCRGRCGPRCR